MTKVDVVVVGSGPNGLAAAVTAARAGLSVTVLEAQPTAGGGARTADLGLADGVVHDLCSAVHPLAWASPFLRAFDLDAHGVQLLSPEISYAHPLGGSRAGLAHHDVERTVDALGADGPAWAALTRRDDRSLDAVLGLTLGDRRSLPPETLGSAGLPSARFLAQVLEQGTRLWNLRFVEETAPAMLTGVAAHAIGVLPSTAAAGTALLLASLAHAGRGWPIPVGGSAAITQALCDDLLRHGGQIRTGTTVRGRADLPPARCYLFDTTPRTLVDVVGEQLSPRTVRALQRFRHGDGAAKVDLVLSGPIPWTATEVGRAGTVHLGGTRAEMVLAEAQVASGRHPARPVTLVSDPSVVDPGRTRDGLRPVWTYAHVPAGSDADMTEPVLTHLERYAPGVRDLVVASRCVPAAQMSGHNASYVGGDIGSGAVTLRQMLARPTFAADPYRMAERIYLCSASTPPGPGVHGMGGWHAARRALRQVFGIRLADLRAGL